VPAIAIAALITGVLASAAGILVWYTAWTTCDLPNIDGGRYIATGGRWTGTTGILLWVGGAHGSGTAMTVLVAASAAAATATHFTKPRRLTTPRSA